MVGTQTVKKEHNCGGLGDIYIYIYIYIYIGKKFSIRQPLTCLTQNIVYLAYCTKCGLQGLGLTVKWKARLANYKSHINKRIKKPCRFVKHFMNTCTDPAIPHKYLRFIIIDLVNNT